MDGPGSILGPKTARLATGPLLNFVDDNNVRERSDGRTIVLSGAEVERDCDGIRDRSVCAVQASGSGKSEQQISSKQQNFSVTANSNLPRLCVFSARYPILRGVLLANHRIPAQKRLGPAFSTRENKP